VKSGTAVLDASVLVRATVAADRDARDWLRAVELGEVAGLVPDLLWIEYANALLGYIRGGFVAAPDAAELLSAVELLPVTTYPDSQLGSAALAIAVERGLTVYDAAYVALAEASEATLVTADRRLAEAYRLVELLA
jgi:predicted nucleic acid-binding protein